MPDTRVTDSILCLATRNWWEKWCVGRKAPLSFHHCLAASALSSLSLLHGIWFSDHGILSTLDWLIWLAYERQEMGYHCCLLRYTILVYVLCLYDVKLYLGKRVDMLTVRMKSIWISFDCDQASHSAVVLWDVQWAEAPHADAQRNHPLHPSPPRITRLKRPVFSNVWSLSSFKTQEFIVSHHQNRDVPFSQTPPGIPENFSMKAWRCQTKHHR